MDRSDRTHQRTPTATKTEASTTALSNGDSGMRAFVTRFLGTAAHSDSSEISCDGAPFVETYAPHEWTTTVPSDCSQVIVPVDAMICWPGVPSLAICIDIVSVQS